MAIRILNNHYKSKKLNPEIVWRLINKNIDEKNQVYNAFINRCENSVEQAKESRKRFDKNACCSVLDGVPIVVKDNFCVEGQFTTCGSMMLKNFKPRYTATIVSKLLKAGAIIVGKTNMDEFAMGSGSVNSTFGAIHNPWLDNDGEICVTGGSSGGTAVAVAAGWALAGLGTDTGGSIRLPATLTGLVGLKPTYGALSRHGVIALINSLDTPSIMARQVDDAQLVFDLLKGRDLRDPTSVDYPQSAEGGRRAVGQETDIGCLTDINSKSGDGCVVSGSKVVNQEHKVGCLTGIEAENVGRERSDISKLRIGVPQEFYPEGMSEDIVSLWDETAEYLAGLGCQVMRVSLPHMTLAGKCYSVLCCAEVASNMSRYDGVRYGGGPKSSALTNDAFFDELVAKTRSDSLGSSVKERILMGNFFLLRGNREQYFEQATKIWRLICEDFEAVFKKVDVLLTPAAMTDAPAVKNYTVMDNRVAMVKGDICTQPSSLAGIPAMTVPGRLSSRGLPIGVQLMAAKFREDLLFDVGRVIEGWADFNHRHQFVHEQALNNIDQSRL